MTNRLMVDFKNGLKDELEAFAKENGLSQNAAVNMIVKQRLKNGKKITDFQTYLQTAIFLGIMLNLIIK